MARLQLALIVSNLEAAVDFYSKLFNVLPAKLHPGYANFSVTDPPLKLVLIEGPRGGSINHLGVEVDSSGAVAEATEALRNFGFEYESEEATTCCYAVQDKVWTAGPDAERWEIYTVLEDADTSVERRGCCEADATDAINLPKQHCC
jgi:catechol 2,3-dioxygenase-like lactoylglutathione lyase family enzyme